MLSFSLVECLRSSPQLCPVALGGLELFLPRLPSTRVCAVRNSFAIISFRSSFSVFFYCGLFCQSNCDCDLDLVFPRAHRLALSICHMLSDSPFKTIVCQLFRRSLSGLHPFSITLTAVADSTAKQVVLLLICVRISSLLGQLFFMCPIFLH